MWLVDIFRIGKLRRQLAVATEELASLKSKLSDATVLRFPISSLHRRPA